MRTPHFFFFVLLNLGLSSSRYVPLVVLKELSKRLESLRLIFQSQMMVLLCHDSPFFIHECEWTLHRCQHVASNWLFDVLFWLLFEPSASWYQHLGLCGNCCSITHTNEYHMSHISQFVFIFSCSLPTNGVSILEHLLLVSLVNVLLVQRLNDVCMLLLWYKEQHHSMEHILVVVLESDLCTIVDQQFR